MSAFMPSMKPRCFEVQAAGVEGDALADQRDVALGVQRPTWAISSRGGSSAPCRRRRCRPARARRLSPTYSITSTPSPSAARAAAASADGCSSDGGVSTRIAASRAQRTVSLVRASGATGAPSGPNAARATLTFDGSALAVNAGIARDTALAVARKSPGSSSSSTTSALPLAPHGRLVSANRTLSARDGAL
jgi:hypothetical protein